MNKKVMQSLKFKEPVFFVLLAIGPTAIATGLVPALLVSGALSYEPSTKWLAFWCMHAVEIGAASLFLAFAVSWLAERIWPTNKQPKQQTSSDCMPNS